MTEFLLELRSEEIPARMQAKAAADLARLFTEQLAAAGLTASETQTYVTPRRLALIARGLPQGTEAQSEEIKGPRTSAPPQALEGFLRKTGLTQDQLEDRDGIWFASKETPGRDTRDVLAEAIPAIVRAFPWPKSMRWGAASTSTESLRWVRPLHGIVALFGGDLVPCTIGEVTSGYETLGHRFHHPGVITIGGADDYAEKLRACHVIVDAEERRAIIRDGAKQLAADQGLDWIVDEALVAENAGLTEWPVPLIGSFDPDFLSVPREVIQLTLATNQKYFVLNDNAGKLAPAFICVANIDANDGGAAIVDGNRKVLAARLSDARFFWDVDRKKTLAEHAEGLARITFHEKLGSVADKVERVAKLAEWLANEGIVPNCDPKLAKQAAELCKADLVTEMVGEFPELQGLMGGYYARAEGLPDAVADAIRDHYKPVGQGDEVPTEPVTLAVSLADKLDTIAGFFAVGEKPTGSKDPFALRRAALGVISLITENGLRLEFRRTLIKAISEHALGWWGRLLAVAKRYDAEGSPQQRAFASLASEHGIDVGEAEQRKVSAAIEGRLPISDLPSAIFAFSDQKQLEIVPFFGERLIVQQREAGIRHDLIDAVFALGGEDDLVRLLARVHALQSFITTEDGTNLLSGYKRASNILKKEDWHGVEGEIAQTGEEDPLALVDDPDMKAVIDAKMAERHAKTLSYTPEPAEDALIQALAAAEPAAAVAVAAEDFASAMAALASLRAPIDRFFEEVTVNDECKPKRAARLDLLARFRAAVHTVADFSRIEG